jgi:chromosome segregation ATPase
VGGEDTPTRPYPVLRHGLEAEAGADGKAIDSVWFAEWRREITAALREIRRDHTESLKGIEARLSGIENRLNDGDSTIRKHDDQILELIDQAAEHGRRLGAVEAHQIDAIVARVSVLEEDRRDRRAADDAARQAAKAAKSSLWVRSRDAAVISAAGAVGLTIVGVLGWLVSLYVKAHP